MTRPDKHAARFGDAWRYRAVGRWTRAEVEEINRRAHERWLRFQELVG